MLAKIYQHIENINSLYTWILVFGAGIFCLMIDSKILMRKKLRREAKICKTIGWIYVLGGVGLYIVINIGNAYFR